MVVFASAENTRMRFSKMPASCAARPGGGEGSSIPVLWWIGRAQEEQHGVGAVGRGQGENAEGEATLGDLHAGAARTGRLATDLWGEARGPGIHRGVLEAGVEHPGGAVRSAGGERAARQSRAGSE